MFLARTLHVPQLRLTSLQLAVEHGPSAGGDGDGDEDLLLLLLHSQMASEVKSKSNVQVLVLCTLQVLSFSSQAPTHDRPCRSQYALHVRYLALMLLARTLHPPQVLLTSNQLSVEQLELLGDGSGAGTGEGTGDGLLPLVGKLKVTEIGLCSVGVRIW